MQNRTKFTDCQPFAPLDFLARNLDSTNALILAHLKRRNDEEQRLTEFFAVLRAKSAIRDGIRALEELEAAR